MFENQTKLNIEENEESSSIEPEDTSILADIKQPFDPKKVDIDTRTLTLDLVIKRLRANPPEIDLYPDFQRKTKSWSNIKQSQFIESILIRLPLPVFYFDTTESDMWLVIDGVQRLNALKNFMIDQTLVLKGLEFFPHLEGKSFSEIPHEFQRRIYETLILVYLLRPGTPDDIKCNISKRVNGNSIIKKIASK